MKKLILLLALTLLIKVSLAQEAFVVWQVNGHVYKVSNTGKERLTIGSGLTLNDEIELGSNSTVLLICNSKHPININTVNGKNIALSSYQEICNKKDDDFNTSFFKFITHVITNKEVHVDDRLDAMKEYGAANMGDKSEEQIRNYISQLRKKVATITDDQPYQEYMIGYMLEEKGLVNSAHEHYQKAVTLNSNNILFANTLNAFRERNNLK